MPNKHAVKSRGAQILWPAAEILLPSSTEKGSNPPSAIQFAGNVLEKEKEEEILLSNHSRKCCAQFCQMRKLSKTCIIISEYHTSRLLMLARNMQTSNILGSDQDKKIKIKHIFLKLFSKFAHWDITSQ